MVALCNQHFIFNNKSKQTTWYLSLTAAFCSWRLSSKTLQLQTYEVLRSSVWRLLLIPYLQGIKLAIVQALAFPNRQERNRHFWLSPSELHSPEKTCPAAFKECNRCEPHNTSKTIPAARGICAKHRSRLILDLTPRSTNICRLWSWYSPRCTPNAPLAVWMSTPWTTCLQDIF